MLTIFKVFIDFVIILLYFIFCFFFFFSWLQEIWNLSSLTRDLTYTPGSPETIVCLFVCLKPLFFKSHFYALLFLK